MSKLPEAGAFLFQLCLVSHEELCFLLIWLGEKTSGSQRLKA